MRIEAWATSSITLGWYRAVVPLRELAAHGHHVVIRRVQNDDNTPATGWPLPVLWTSPGADVEAVPEVLFFHRVYVPSLIARINRMAATTRIVFGLDDDMFGSGFTPPVTGPGAHGLPGGYNPAAVMRDRVAACLRVAHSVIVTTQPLAKVATQHGARRVDVVPNYLPRCYLDHPRAAHRPDRFVIGWGGTESHRGDLNSIQRPVLDAVSAHPDNHVHLIGYRDGSLWANLPPRQRTYTPHRDRWAYFNALNFDVGLAPARRTAVNASRSDAKVLEYATRGIPSIAAPTGESATFVRTSGSGLLAATDEEWTDALERMRDPELRRDFSDAARQAAATRAIEDHWWLWLDALS